MTHVVNLSNLVDLYSRGETLEKKAILLEKIVNDNLEPTESLTNLILGDLSLFHKEKVYYNALFKYFTYALKGCIKFNYGLVCKICHFSLLCLLSLSFHIRLLAYDLLYLIIYSYETDELSSLNFTKKDYCIATTLLLNDADGRLRHVAIIRAVKLILAGDMDNICIEEVFLSCLYLVYDDDVTVRLMALDLLGSLGKHCLSNPDRILLIDGSFRSEFLERKCLDQIFIVLCDILVSDRHKKCRESAGQKLLEIPNLVSADLIASTISKEPIYFETTDKLSPNLKQTSMFPYKIFRRPHCQLQLLSAKFCCGAASIALEDEIMQVRLVAIRVIVKWLNELFFANHPRMNVIEAFLSFLIDMFHDEHDRIRFQSLKEITSLFSIWKSKSSSFQFSEPFCKLLVSTFVTHNDSLCKDPQSHIRICYYQCVTSIGRILNISFQNSDEKNTPSFVFIKLLDSLLDNASIFPSDYFWLLECIIVLSKDLIDTPVIVAMSPSSESSGDSIIHVKKRKLDRYVPSIIKQPATKVEDASIMESDKLCENSRCLSLKLLSVSDIKDYGLDDPRVELVALFALVHACFCKSEASLPLALQKKSLYYWFKFNKILRKLDFESSKDPGGFWKFHKMAKLYDSTLPKINLEDLYPE